MHRHMHVNGESGRVTPLPPIIQGVYTPALVLHFAHFEYTLHYVAAELFSSPVNLDQRTIYPMHAIQCMPGFYVTCTPRMVLCMQVMAIHPQALAGALPGFE